MHNKIKALIPVFVLMAVTLPSFAIEGNSQEITREEKQKLIEEHKEELRSQKTGEIEERKMQAQEKKTDMVSNRCDMANRRVEEKLGKYAENKNHAETVYKNLQVRLDVLITKAQEAGYDTEALEASLVGLQERIDVVVLAHEEYTQALTQTREWACGESDGQYANALQSARGQLSEVRAAMVEVKEYFKNEVQPLIKDLRTQTVNETE